MLPDAPDAAGFYLDKMRARHTHQTAKQGIIDAQNALNAQEPGKAIEALRKAAKAANVNGGTRRVDSYADAKIEALWPDVLWRGKYTLLAGDAGLGKSTVCADVIARVTTGQPFPCSTHSIEPGNVVLLSAEDDVADTIKHRLVTAGADLTRVHVIESIEGVWPSLRDHLEQIRSRLESVKAVLLVIDPITAYLGDVDSHRTGDVRGILGPLQDVLRDTGAAMLAVSHPNKNTSARALHRVTGAQAFVDASRATFCIGKRSENPDVLFMVPLKNNLSATKPGFDLTIVDVDGHPCVKWSAMPVFDKADDLLNASESNAHALNEAVYFLKVELADGPALAKDLKKRALEAGHAWRTIERAKKALGIKPQKTGDGWQWQLPELEPKDIEPAEPGSSRRHSKYTSCRFRLELSEQDRQGGVNTKSWRS